MSRQYTELSPQKKATLRDLLVQLFDKDELYALCLRLDEDPDRFCDKNATKPELALKIIEHFQHRGRLRELLDRAAEERPHATWPQFKEAPAVAATDSTVTEEEDKRKVIARLIDHNLLGIRERFGRTAIYPFDEDYWTNLHIEWSSLRLDDDVLDQLANLIVAHYLGGNAQDWVALAPLDFETQDDEFRDRVEVVEKIARKAGLSVTPRRGVHGKARRLVLAAVYSASLRGFLIDFADSLDLAVILVAPASEYLATQLELPHDKISTLVSVDSLADEKFPAARRRMMITGVQR